jgi:hypothetical protein
MKLFGFFNHSGHIFLFHKHIGCVSLYFCSFDRVFVIVFQGATISVAACHPELGNIFYFSIKISPPVHATLDYMLFWLLYVALHICKQR